MLNKLRERMGREEGFTLVELLVVMLILGILAAIAIPSFFNQRDKARDADAKASVRTAQTAIETYATDNGGEYTGADDTALVAIEPTLADAPGTLAVVDADANGRPTGAGPGDDTYAVSVTSSTGNVFSIGRKSDATVELTCETDGSDGCPAATAPATWGDWSGS